MDNQQQQAEHDDNCITISARDFNELKLELAASKVFWDAIVNI
jgi:hypothetical protein